MSLNWSEDPSKFVVVKSIHWNGHKLHVDLKGTACGFVKSGMWIFQKMYVDVLDAVCLFARSRIQIHVDVSEAVNGYGKVLLTHTFSWEIQLLLFIPIFSKFL